MSADKNTKESSFAGFLNNYSRGNTTEYRHLNQIVTIELQKIIETIDELLSNIDHDKFLQLYSQLNFAKETLDAEGIDNLEKLKAFSKILEIVVVLYGPLLGIFPEEKRTRINKVFDKLIVEFLTIVKKIGNSQLIDSSIRLIKKIES